MERERERERDNFPNLPFSDGKEELKSGFLCPGGALSWRGCDQIIKDGERFLRKGSLLCWDCIKLERKVSFWFGVILGSIIGFIVLVLIVLAIFN